MLEYFVMVMQIKLIVVVCLIPQSLNRIEYGSLNFFLVCQAKRGRQRTNDHACEWRDRNENGMFRLGLTPSCAYMPNSSSVVYI